MTHFEVFRDSGGIPCLLADYHTVPPMARPEGQMQMEENQLDDYAKNVQKGAALSSVISLVIYFHDSTNNNHNSIIIFDTVFV